MTATDELRRLLDERGVEWGNIRNDGSESDYLTEWQFENNQGKAIAIEWAVGSGLSVEIHRYDLTPEQAIEATLGSDLKAENAKLREEFDKMDKWHSAELIAEMKENAKLRELVRDMLDVMLDYRCDIRMPNSLDYSNEPAVFKKRARELGVDA